jgi:hypothetical protein
MDRGSSYRSVCRLLLLAGLLIVARGAPANAADRWRLVSIPLDMPMDDRSALDDQALEGLYQGDYGTHMAHNFGGYIGPNLRDSGLNESPFYHIDSTLKDGRTFELWFSSEDDGQKVFGVRLTLPYDEKRYKPFAEVLREIETAYGQADLEFNPSDVPAQKIMVIADRTMPKDRYATVLARLPKAASVSPKDRNSFWNADLRKYARVLGPDFRGVIVVLNEQSKTGKLISGEVQLLDLARARTVFTLDSPK